MSRPRVPAVRASARPFGTAFGIIVGATLLLASCGGPREVRENWSTGLPMREGKVVDDQQSGSWTYWFDNGQRQAVGSWEHDHQIGEWTWWYANGKMKDHGSYAAGGKRIGAWQHYHDNGQLASDGGYQTNQQTGLWRYRYASGAVYADGWFDRGVKTGVWRLWTEDGKLKDSRTYFNGLKIGPSELVDPALGLPSRDFGLPKGFEGVISVVSDGLRWTMSRPGAATGDGMTLFQGAQGRVAYVLTCAGQTFAGAWHANGALALAGDGSAAPKQGHWRYWHDNGQLAVEGTWEQGRLVTWKSWRADGTPWQDALPGAAPAAAPAGPEDDAAVAAPETPDALVATADRMLPQATVTVGADVDAAAAPAAAKTASRPAPGSDDSDRVTPFDAAPTVARATVAQRPAAQVAVTPTDVRQLEGPAEVDSPALSPTQALPTFWTKLEEAKAGDLIVRYSSGSVADGVADEYAVDASVPSQRRDLIGKPLPQTRFLSSAGEVIDLASFAGQKPVVVVLLRGFAGQVCLYCAAQTAALCNRIDDLRKSGAEVVVIYPGPAESIPTFLQAVQTLRKDPPKLTVALDVSLLLVRALGVEDNLSRPTSVVIDRGGKVSYVYVGKTMADRPSVDDLLHELAKIVK